MVTTAAIAQLDKLVLLNVALARENTSRSALISKLWDDDSAYSLLAEPLRVSCRPPVGSILYAIGGEWA